MVVEGHLASRCVYLDSGGASLGVQHVSSGSLDCDRLFFSGYHSLYQHKYAVRPVASITWGYMTNGYVREK